MTHLSIDISNNFSIHDQTRTLSFCHIKILQQSEAKMQVYESD